MKKLYIVLALLLLVPVAASANTANSGKKRISVCNRIVNAKDYQVTATSNSPAGNAGHEQIEIAGNSCIPAGSGGGDGENPWTFFVNGQEIPQPKVKMRMTDEVAEGITEKQASYQIRSVDGAIVLQFIGSFTK